MSTNIHIQQVDFNDYFNDLKKIRTTVFIEEQHVPIELEWDEFDETATHILAFKDARAIATARLLNDGHIGRMAVLAEYRNQGVGKAMLEYLLQLAKKRHISEIKLSAQKHATGFYQKSGFCISSDEFLDAGIPHYSMRYNIKYN